ncbi:NAD(P)-dependent oxidoreductase [Chelatococcus sp. GCM10030263]|uniref:NAD(P)-dependent oxidoreductase n=1 Tax=Chelatococcus sp. GCM10030263 TaxID=3273387 RepID=UPI0036110381
MKILLTHGPHMRRNYYGDRALSRLRDMAEVVLHERDEPLDPSALVAAARDVDVIVCDRQTPAPAAVFEGLPQLKALLRVAVDIRTIDLPAASAAGVLVTRAAPGFVPAVAELALGFLVDLARGISQTAAAYHAGRAPEIRMGRQLAGSTIGIIGYGSIGRRLASLVLALDMRVLVADPFATVDEARIEQVSLDELLARADHVVCLATATEETESLMDAAAFARMKADAVFINLSRGNLVDEGALAAALREGRIAGAAMDVGRAPDQMPSAALAQLPNVVATPHIGGLTPQAIEAQAFDSVEQVAALLRGEVPDGAVNADAWSRRI